MALYRMKSIYRKKAKVLSKYGFATGLSVGRSSLSAISIGNYALFGGGDNGNYNLNTVDAYDTSLTRSNPTNLYQARSILAATTVGDYALFGGGYPLTGTVDAYNTSLTRSNPEDLDRFGIYSLAATSIGNYALFGGGYSGSNPNDAIYYYNNSLTRLWYGGNKDLSIARYNLAATSIGNYALFGGGSNNNNSLKTNAGKRVDAYDTSLTRSNPTDLSSSRYALAATTVGDYALFGGGADVQYGSLRNIVDAYDTSLTRSNPTTLNVGRTGLAATTVGDYALFAGGGQSNDTKNIVDVYDKSLVHTIATPLDPGRYDLAATSIGDYALFGGGFAGAPYGGYLKATVDVYKVA